MRGERRFYVGERIKELREARGIGQLALAVNIKKRPETIWRWERGGGIKESDCRRLARALNVTFDEIVQTPLPHGAEPLRTSYVKVPLLGICPASDKKIVLDEVIEWEWLPREDVRGRRVYLLKVKGDSMNRAGIDDGDKILVDAEAQPDNGQVVVARIDGESTIKRFYRDGTTVTLSPDSTNPKHQPRMFTKQNEIMLRGVVRSVWMKRVK